MRPLHLLFLVLCVSAPLREALPAAAQPNILFLLSDDQDWTGLDFPQHPDYPAGSCQPFFETPNLRALAGQGVLFTDAYAPSPVCSATRMALQTGMTTARTGWTKAAPILTARHNPKLLPPPTLRNFDPDEFTTIAELLSGAGYLCAHYGKWHINGGGPEANGYHDSDGANGNEVAFREEMKGDPNPVDLTGMTDRAGAFMRRAKEAGRPFFIQMSYHALHAAEHARQSSIDHFAQKAATQDFRKPPAGAALTRDLDQAVGDLLADLATLGFVENTYVIYMSDNGGGGKNRERVLRGGKGTIWEGGLRSPLIARGPGISPGTVSRARVTALDLFPTFCHWAGVQPDSLPAALDGGNIAHVLQGDDATPVQRSREEIIFHFPHYQGDAPMSALYLGDHKLIHHYETGTSSLYKLRDDIGEASDLSDQHPAETAQLLGLLFAYLDEVGAQRPAPNPDHDPSKPTITQQGGHGSKADKAKAKGKKRPGR